MDLVKMEELMPYIQELVDTPYVWWRAGESTLDHIHPFYAKPVPLPCLEDIKRLGTNCAGFINLLCRKVGATIPGVKEGEYYAGGTYVWYEWLKARGKLSALDMRIYPAGTLLLTPYISPEYQGHVALVTTPGTIKTLKISHSFSTSGLVMDEPAEITHRIIESGYYTDTARFEDWLMIN